MAAITIMSQLLWESQFTGLPLQKTYTAGQQEKKLVLTVVDGHGPQSVPLHGDEFDRLEAAEILKRFRSAWGALILAVPKEVSHLWRL